jgi:hypothetical protein
MNSIGAVVPCFHFHSHSLDWVFPSASTSNSNTAATLFSRASFGEAVL